MPTRIPFLPLFFVLLLSFQSNAQLSRIWEYSFSPPENLEASGTNIIVLPSGNIVTAGIYKNNSSFNTKNTLLLSDSSGNLLDADSATIGPGFRKVVYDGGSYIYAAATHFNDTIPANKIIIARFDTTFADRDFFIPDSSVTFPHYQVLDMTLLSNGNILIASNYDAFPVSALSVMCFDSAGNVLWERVDSSFQFFYNVKVLADESGGVFVAGSGRDTSTSYDFIFFSHYSQAGSRTWVNTYESPAQFFADLTDIIRSPDGNLYVTGAVMEISGQVGFLIKSDSLGNIHWNNAVTPLAYQRIVADVNGGIYGASVPQNGIDVISLYKMDSSGVILDSISVQQPDYFTSELGDMIMTNSGVIAATGSLFVLSFPKSDLFVVAIDTMLNLVGFDIVDSMNFLGESGRSIAEGAANTLYTCGRFNYENTMETCNIGIAKYEFEPIITFLPEVRNESFQVFPNPTTGELNIRYGKITRGNASILIHDLSGKAVYLNDEVDQNVNEIQLSLQPGFYLLTIEESGNRETRKICVTASE